LLKIASRGRVLVKGNPVSPADLPAIFAVKIRRTHKFVFAIVL
jgi:hypothetical protein